MVKWDAFFSSYNRKSDSWGISASPAMNLAARHWLVYYSPDWSLWRTRVPPIRRARCCSTVAVVSVGGRRASQQRFTRERTHKHEKGARGRARPGLLLLWCNGDCAVGGEPGVEWVPSTVGVKRPTTVSPGQRARRPGTVSKHCDKDRTWSFHTPWKHTARCVR